MVDRAVQPPDAPAPVLPIEDTIAEPRAPLDVADDNAPCTPAGRAPAANASALDPAWATQRAPPVLQA